MADSTTLILQSTWDYDTHWPILDESFPPNENDTKAPRMFTDARGEPQPHFTIPGYGSVGNDNIRNNVVEIEQADYDYLTKKYKAFRDHIKSGRFRLLETKPLNYLTAAAQIANARSDANDALQKVAAAQAVVDAKDAEIAALRAELAGFGGSVVAPVDPVVPTPVVEAAPVAPVVEAAPVAPVVTEPLIAAGTEALG
jgi:hypothetical protein